MMSVGVMQKLVSTEVLGFADLLCGPRLKDRIDASTGTRSC
jgi:hypothetical protein